MESHRQLLVAAVLLALSVAAAALPSAQNYEIQIPGYGAKIVFRQNEAALSIYPQLHNASMFYNLKFSHMVESNESESTPFQRAVFDQAIIYTGWQTLQNDSSNLIQSMNMSTSVSLPDGTKLPIRIRYFMYHNEAVVQQGTESIAVANGSLKFTFEMDNWPFKGTQNFVFLHTSITSSDVVSYSALLRATGQVRRLSVHPTQSHNNSLFIDFPITGILDSENHNIDIKVQSGSATAFAAPASAGQYIDLVFAFPYFSKGLSYDPNVGLEMMRISTPLAPSQPSFSLALILTLVTIATAVAIFGLVLAIQSYRRWRDRQRYSRMI